MGESTFTNKHSNNIAHLPVRMETYFLQFLLPQATHPPLTEPYAKKTLPQEKRFFCHHRWMSNGCINRGKARGTMPIIVLSFYILVFAHVLLLLTSSCWALACQCHFQDNRRPSHKARVGYSAGHQVCTKGDWSNSARDAHLELPQCVLHRVSWMQYPRLYHPEGVCHICHKI